MNQLVLELKNLSVGYDDHPILTHLNLSINSGESIALIGPNGSGKSTLLKTLVKSLKPRTGEILIDGLSVSRLTDGAIAQRIGFVPQSESVEFAFSVRQVVTMGRLARSQTLFDTQEDYDVATKSMQDADCLYLADRSVLELSGGEYQRVLIARALAQTPSVLILDEPTSHLDISHQVAVAQIIQNFTAQGGVTITAVHDLNLAQFVARRGWLLSEGQLIYDGDIEDLLLSPKLEKTYGAEFERIRNASGILRIFPKFPIPK